MEIVATDIDEVWLLKPVIHGDSRGFFLESFRQSWFDERGVDVQFVQDNHSGSGRGVLRGLHYQLHEPQGKLVRVVRGEVYDVAVDLRRSSPTFGRYVGARLSAENGHQLWVPPGFGHGFYVLSDFAEFVYKCTAYYAPQHERSIIFDDPDIGIDWPIDVGGRPRLSDKDAAAPRLADAEVYE